MTALAAVLGVSSQQVVPALEHIIGGLPLRVSSIHSDNGSELINHHMLRMVNRKGIHFTRSHPGHKNDNPHVEQKNWTCVRRAVGYRRYDTAAQMMQLDRVYQLLDAVINLFEPSAKRVSKSRDNAVVSRVCDTPTTPIDHLVKHYQQQGKRPPAKVTKLLRLRKSLDPFILYEQLEQEITALKNLLSAFTSQSTGEHHMRKKH